MNLSGFTNPLSPTGRAELVEQTPHHISADAIRVMFKAGEDVAARYLPAPLTPVEDGIGFAYVADMLKLSAAQPDQPFLNPERTQYGEGIVGFYARFGQVTGRFSAFIWVTQDWSMGFGQAMGWAKKMANVHRTRINSFNPGMKEVGAGSRLSGAVHRHGNTLLRVGAEIERPEQPTALPGYGDRGFMLRYFPSVGPDIPETRQLVSLRLSDVATGDVYSGRPFLEFGYSDNEELDALRDVVPLRAYAYKQGWTTDSVVQLEHDYNAAKEAVL
jgi:hypothetical protein